MIIPGRSPAHDAYHCDMKLKLGMHQAQQPMPTHPLARSLGLMRDHSQLSFYMAQVQNGFSSRTSRTSLG